ncbi:10408_t:CDS:2 [Entrophospora sp. SA101]|nr:10408_t:CDS:2 [Entrophospora sp. SA101]
MDAVATLIATNNTYNKNSNNNDDSHNITGQIEDLSFRSLLEHHNMIHHGKELSANIQDALRIDDGDNDLMVFDQSNTVATPTTVNMSNSCHYSW